MHWQHNAVNMRLVVRIAQAIYVFASFCGGAVAQHASQVPGSPCPRLFRYVELDSAEVIGVVRFENDLSGVYDLEVNMSIALETKNNIRLVRRTQLHRIQDGDPLEYHIHFPFDQPIPVLTSVVFNGKFFCVGPPAKGLIITALSKRDILRTRVVDSSKSNRPQITNAVTVPSTTTSSTTQIPPQILPIQIEIQNHLGIDNECGINHDVQPLILNGDTTKSGEYPWLVALFFLERSSYGFKCAGTLISAKHVLTAAHCTRFPNGVRVEKESLLLVLGKHNIKNWAIKSTIRGVEEILPHPDFKRPADADIALITMESEVIFSSTIRPICLWDEPDRLDNIVTQNGVVAGWGRDELGRDFVSEPRQVSMPIVSQVTCLRSDDRYLKITSDRTFCAGNRKGASPCTGDSGGGLVMYRGGRWKLRGVVSVALVDSNTHSCDPNNYVVFSDAPKYIDWLKGAMEPI